MTEYIKKELICQKVKMIKEYERIKKKESKYFKSVKDLCKFYGVSRKTFYKWLNRYYKSNCDPNSLLPQKRIPKTNKNMPTKDVERIIVKMRKKLKYSALLISVILRKKGISKISEFGVYQVFKRYKVGPKYEKKNKKEELKFYEKENPWELIPCDTIYAVLTDNGKAYTCRTKKGRGNHIFEKLCKELNIKHKRTKIRRPLTNGKVEYTHWLYDKEFYKRYKFLSFKDRDEKLKEWTNYLNYIKPNIAIGGLTPYEKFLKIRNEKVLTKDLNCAMLNSTMMSEVINKN